MNKQDRENIRALKYPQFKEVKGILRDKIPAETLEVIAYNKAIDHVLTLLDAEPEQQKPDCQYVCEADEGKYEKMCDEYFEKIKDLEQTIHDQALLIDGVGMPEGKKALKTLSKMRDLAASRVCEQNLCDRQLTIEQINDAYETIRKMLEGV